jgi:integrase
MKAGTLKDALRRCPENNFERLWRVIKKRAGIKSGTFHDLRRTCITEWAESGMHPHEVMVLAGHSEVKTTMMYYIGLNREFMDKARRASQAALA